MQDSEKKNEGLSEEIVKLQKENEDLKLLYNNQVFDRNQKEEVLKKMQALLNETCKIAKVGGWEFDIETKLQSWTDEVYRIHEVDFSFVPTVKNGIDFYTPNSKPIISKAVQKTIEKGEPFNLELEIITAKKNHCWVHAIGKANYSDGKIIGVSGTIQNITERKKLEFILKHNKVIKEENEEYKALNDKLVHANKKIVQNEDLLNETGRIAKIGGWEADVATQKIQWTNEVYRIHELAFSYKPTVEKIFDFCTPESRKKIEKAIQRTMEFGESFDLELEIITAKRNRRWVQEIGKGNFTKDKVTSISGTFLDITERKRTEEALRKQQAILDVVMESSTCSIFSVDKEYRYTSFNKANARNMKMIYGVDIELGVSGESYENIKQDWNRIKPNLDRAFKGESFVISEYISDSNYIEISHFPIYSDNGEVVGVSVFSNDVTERQQNEAKLKQVFENWQTTFDAIEDIVLLLNVDHEITEINKAGLKIVGMERDEAIGKKCHQLMHNSDFPISSCSCSISMIDKVPIIVEFTENNKTFESSAWPIFDENNNIKSFTHIIKNITERKKADVLIQEKTVELLELNATKDKFFSIIAYDLRSPFNAIIGLSEMLQNNTGKYSKEKITEFATHIYSSANHTYKLLENLLEWSKLQRGLITPNFKIHNLKTIIDEVTLLKVEAAKNKNIIVENNILSDISINCDIDMTKTIIRNLMSNAIKFTNSNGLISIDAYYKNGDVEIQIKDNGVGIAQKDIQNLFKIESSISTTGTAKEVGTGLGLLLCKELIEKQGGKIWVESEIGNGSSFYFTLNNRIKNTSDQ